MKQLLESIQKLKTYSNIGNWFFDDEEIYVDGQFRTGKVLTLYTTLTSHPKEFPSNEMERNLMREIGLNLVGWRTANSVNHSHHRYFKIYKLTQVERFRTHCVRRTCINMMDNREGLIRLDFTRGRVGGELDAREQQIIQRLSYIKDADTDYWDLGCIIRYGKAIQDEPIDVVMDLHIEPKASITGKLPDKWIHMPGAKPEFNIKGTETGRTSCGPVCSTCNGTNYYLGHPQGTPGPCPDCNDTCKDCKGTGYYQPLIGPRENCQTCGSN